jgi:glucose-6-phosphate isomerase
MQNLKLTELFKKNPNRAKTHAIQLDQIYCDYSKNHINPEIMQDLISWTEKSNLKDKVHALFSGEIINNTEQRAVMHTALRCVPNKKFTDIIPLEIQTEINLEHIKLSKFVNNIHNEKWLGSTNKPIKHIVNIGIGGSDLGPKMITHALSHYALSDMQCYFVSNIDATDILSVLKKINPEQTLFIIASKSFTTLETKENALTARKWLISEFKKINPDHNLDLAKHFVSITSNIPKACEFGIDKNNCFKMWDWVGGRYSLWSSIGLPIALACGMDNFNKLLLGAATMDEHFFNNLSKEKIKHNMPAMLGLIGAYYRNNWNTSAHAILPYDQNLMYLPDYLQQADMESNGKSVYKNGDPVTQKTGPIIWGGVGTNGQHAYFQLLHQGTNIIPIDFIIAKNNHHNLKHHQEALIANCIAQAQALMQGLSEEEAYKDLLDKNTNPDIAKFLAKHKAIPGNKPSTMILIDKITPYTLGQLIACYEHKIFTQSVLWDINAFDQWGVELGKKLAGPVLDKIQSGEIKLDESDNIDPSSLELINKILNK